MPVEIEVQGLEELRARLRAVPQLYNAYEREAIEAALLVLQENVPEYPPPPEGSTYVRTGTLGRSMGSGMGGGNLGAPDIRKVRKIGGGHEGVFGTALGYAPHVIGERTQAEVHRGRWWTIRDIADKAAPKITELFKTMTNRLAAFLNRGTK